MGGNEQKFINEAFAENWIAPLGPNVNGFEQEIVNYARAGNCAALSSGTAAIHLALILLGVAQGDDVICSSFTFSASCNPIVYQKAIPVFVDSEKDSWNMDPALLRKAIEERMKITGKKPKAIVLVYLYGMPAKIEEILAIAEEYDIPVIEDAAEALGSTYKGIALGTFGDFGVYSFNGNKIITTSGGGALVSKNGAAIQKARFLATQARDEAPHYQHTHIGYNYRMSNIVAGIGRGQLQVLDKWVQLRRKINAWYKEIFKQIEGITFLEEPNADYFSNFWLTTILVNPKLSLFSAEDLRDAFEKDNIETRPLWKPMHLQPVFQQYPSYTNGVSEDLFAKGMCLPSGSNLTKEELERIKKAIQTLI